MPSSTRVTGSAARAPGGPRAAAATSSVVATARGRAADSPAPGSRIVDRPVVGGRAARRARRRAVGHRGRGGAFGGTGAHGLGEQQARRRRVPERHRPVALPGVDPVRPREPDVGVAGRVVAEQLRTDEPVGGGPGERASRCGTGRRRPRPRARRPATRGPRSARRRGSRPARRRRAAPATPRRTRRPRSLDRPAPRGRSRRPARPPRRGRPRPGSSSSPGRPRGARPPAARRSCRSPRRSRRAPTTARTRRPATRRRRRPRASCRRCRRAATPAASGRAPGPGGRRAACRAARRRAARAGRSA